MNNLFESFGKFLTESSSEENSFINNIFDNPLDSTVMLVYADWLQERDDPFNEIIRQALNSSTSENYNKKDKSEESFFNILDKKYKNNFEAYGLLNVNFRQGTFAFIDPDDKLVWTVSVNPTGQIMVKTNEIDRPSRGTPYRPMKLDDLKPMIAKRTALLLLLEQMVDSHRLRNAHGHHAPRRRGLKSLPDNQFHHSTWVDRATHSVEVAMQWFIDSGAASSTDDEMAEALEELIDHYMTPLENMSIKIRKGENPADKSNFDVLANNVMDTAVRRGVCSQSNMRLCNQFRNIANNIMSKMK